MLDDEVGQLKRRMAIVEQRLGGMMPNLAVKPDNQINQAFQTLPSAPLPLRPSSSHHGVSPLPSSAIAFPSLFEEIIIYRFL
jgi:hypothetical protein